MLESKVYKYYDNYAGLTVDEYVDQYIYSNSEEMDRISATVRLLPEDILTVLDVGAGHGVFLEMLEKNRGLKGIGIEITDTKVEYGQKKGLDVRKGSAVKLDFPDKSFDVVVSMEVIEHLPFGEYERALEEFQRIARKYVLISVPYDEDRTFVQCPYCSSITPSSLHMRAFNDFCMPGLLDRSTLRSIDKAGQVYQVYKVINKIRSFGSRGLSMFFECPVCGFRNLGSQSNGEIETDNSYKFGKILTAAIKKLVTRKRPRWFLALYEVNS